MQQSQHFTRPEFITYRLSRTAAVQALAVLCYQIVFVLPTQHHYSASSPAVCSCLTVHFKNNDNVLTATVMALKYGIIMKLNIKILKQPLITH